MSRRSVRRLTSSRSANSASRPGAVRLEQGEEAQHPPGDIHDFRSFSDIAVRI